MNNSLFNEVIDRNLEKLNELEPGTEEYSKVVGDTTQLMDRAINLDEKDNSKRDQFWKNVVTVTGIALPIASAFIGTVITLRYEDHGAITYKAGRSWTDRLLKINK